LNRVNQFESSPQLASAISAGSWKAIWINFVAPILAMLLAVLLTH
jgi:hypothetical protein